jgi:hypothetical protein
MVLQQALPLCRKRICLFTLRALIKIETGKYCRYQENNKNHIVLFMGKKVTKKSC